MPNASLDYNYYTDTTDANLPYQVIYANGQPASQFSIAGNAEGAYGSLVTFDATRSHSPVEAPTHVLFEDLRNYRLEAAVAAGNPTLTSPDPQAGLTMLDAAFMSANWPFGDTLGAPGWQDENVANTSPYAISSVASSDSDFGGFHILNGYGSTWHTLCFWGEVQHGMSVVLQSSYADITSPHYGVTYRTLITGTFAPNMRRVIYWRNFGGTENYASPPAPNLDGSYSFGSLHSGDLSQNAAFAHRQFSAAAMCLYCYLLNGSTDAPLWWLYNYYLSKGFSMVRADGSTIENGGYDSSYAATSLYYLDWLYCYAPTGNDAIYSTLVKVATWEASRITNTGGVNCWGNSRVNPYLDPNPPYEGLLTGQPIVELSPGPPPVFEYAGETTQGSGHTNPKGVDWIRLFFALGQAGKIVESVTSSDNGWVALSALIPSAKNTVYIAPVTTISSGSPLPQSMQSAIAQFRKSAGTPITFSGNTYSAISSTIPANRSGVNFLPKELLPFESAADSRVFSLTLSDFGNNPIPSYASIVTYKGSNYFVSRVAYEDYGDVTVSLRLFCYRMLDNDITQVFLDKAFTLWTPANMISQLDGTGYNVKDVGFNNADTINAMLIPLTHAEKMGILGRIDIRMNVCYASADIPLGSILRDQESSECWLAITKSEYYPATQLHTATLKHLAIAPLSITS